MASGHTAHSLIGAPCHFRQEAQWQMPTAAGGPCTSTSTAPQKHLPVNVRDFDIGSPLSQTATLFGVVRTAAPSITTRIGPDWFKSVAPAPLSLSAGPQELHRGIALPDARDGGPVPR
jgi:hypothetical protein